MVEGHSPMIIGKSLTIWLLYAMRQVVSFSMQIKYFIDDKRGRIFDSSGYFCMVLPSLFRQKYLQYTEVLLLSYRFS